jgi:serine/threonine-protein kinase HipA
MSKCLICYKEDLSDCKYYHSQCSSKIFGTPEPPELPYGLSEMKELGKKIMQRQGVMTGVQPTISLGLEKTRQRRRGLKL